MPYIKKQQREHFDSSIEHLSMLARNWGSKDSEPNEGDLNYIITRLLALAYNMAEDPRYHKINAIVGILECIKLEFYRRSAAGYEDIKAVENGDVLEYKRSK